MKSHFLSSLLLLSSFGVIFFGRIFSWLVRFLCHLCNADKCIRICDFVSLSRNVAKSLCGCGCVWFRLILFYFQRCPTLNLFLLLILKECTCIKCIHVLWHRKSVNISKSHGNSTTHYTILCCCCFCCCYFLLVVCAILRSIFLFTRKCFPFVFCQIQNTQLTRQHTQMERERERPRVSGEESERTSAHTSHSIVKYWREHKSSQLLVYS